MTSEKFTSNRQHGRLPKAGRFFGQNHRSNYSEGAFAYTGVEENIDLQQLASQYHIEYANFRKMFKKYIGVSPRQYHLELMRAKELILSSDKTI